MLDRFIQQAIRFLLYMVLTTMLLSTFLMNWSFLDGTNWNSLKVALDGTAHQPVVYRRLMPETVTLIRAALPPEAKQVLSEVVAPQFYQFYARPLIAHYEKSVPAITLQASLDWEDPEYRVAYVVMYYLCWVCLFLALYVTRQTAALLTKASAGTMRGVAECAPLFAVLCLPFSFLNGGYFYDFPEYLLLSLALYASLSGNLLLLVAASMLAVVNKETAWLFSLFLAPILHHRWGTKKAAIRLVLIVACQLLIAHLIQARYAANAGASHGFILTQNLLFWSTPANWWAVGDHIGRGFFFPRLTLLVMLVAALVYGLRSAPRHVSMATVAALMATGVLLVSIGYRDELRNLSLAFPLVYALVVSAYVEKWRQAQAA